MVAYKKTCQYRATRKKHEKSGYCVKHLGKLIFRPIFCQWSCKAELVACPLFFASGVAKAGPKFVRYMCARALVLLAQWLSVQQVPGQYQWPGYTTGCNVQCTCYTEHDIWCLACVQKLWSPWAVLGLYGIWYVYSSTLLEPWTKKANMQVVLLLSSAHSSTLPSKYILNGPFWFYASPV